MSRRPLQYFAIFLTVFIDILGFGIVIPVLPLYAEHYGATAMQIGWLVGIFSLAQFFLAPVWGKVSDRIGRKPVLLFGVVGTILGYCLMGLAHNVLFLFLGRLIDGIAGANISAAQAYLADISPPEKRARAMGLLGAAFGLGFVFGPALGGWASVQFNYSAPMFIAAGLAALNLVFIVIVLPESNLNRGRKTSDEPLFPTLWAHVDRVQYLTSLACYFLVIAGFSIMTTVFALFLNKRFHLDALHTGYILAAIGIVGVLIQGGLIGRLVARFGEAPLALAGTVFMGLGMVGLACCRSFDLMLLSAGFVGVGNSLLMPTLSALASRAAAPDWQGRALGVVQSGGSLARWFGPIVAGSLLTMTAGGSVDRFATAPLLASAGFLFCAALATSRLLRRPAATFVQNA